MNKLLLFLFTLFLLMMVLDLGMTTYALDNGFYETNNFTNRTSPLFHYAVLTIISVLVYITSEHYNRQPLGIIIFAMVNVGWIINNIISIYLLSLPH